MQLSPLQKKRSDRLRSKPNVLCALQCSPNVSKRSRMRSGLRSVCTGPSPIRQSRTNCKSAISECYESSRVLFGFLFRYLAPSISSVSIVFFPAKFTDVLREIERIANLVGQHRMLFITNCANSVRCRSHGLMFVEARL